MEFTQENRLIAVYTPLEPDTVLLHSFSGVEGISRLFSFSLNLLSLNSSLAFKDIIGQRVTILIRRGSDGPRFINGHISRFTQSGADRNFTYYHAEVVPWLWFLTRNANCRIFQNMKVPDIITKVFQDRGFNDFETRLQGQFPTRDYCVQYRESDFNFVSRLMEQYGIFYFFQHDDKKHVLVLADSSSAARPCPGQRKARWVESAGPGGLPEDEDVITEWRIEQELRSGKYALNDYNFLTPTNSLLANTDSTISLFGNGSFEIYDYPGIYGNSSEGNDTVRLRMEEEEAHSVVATGGGTCRAFTPGFYFELEEHYRNDMNSSYLLTDVRHTATIGDSYVSGGEAGVRYSNQFTSIPSSATFRPLRVTPQPLVQGPQTAIVAGPKGEEIYVDKHGRVKVQFHWDREGQHDEQSSCWIRVSQPWAGKNWGAMAIPRIGQEVVVSFLRVTLTARSLAAGSTTGSPDLHIPCLTNRRKAVSNHIPPRAVAVSTSSALKTRKARNRSLFMGRRISMFESRTIAVNGPAAIGI